MNTRKKITKALVILAAIFVLSMIFAALDSSSQFKTAYDFGFRTEIHHTGRGARGN